VPSRNGDGLELRFVARVKRFSLVLHKVIAPTPDPPDFNAPVVEQTDPDGPIGPGPTPAGIYTNMPSGNEIGLGDWLMGSRFAAERNLVTSAKLSSSA